MNEFKTDYTRNLGLFITSPISSHLLKHKFLLNKADFEIIACGYDIYQPIKVVLKKDKETTQTNYYKNDGVSLF